MSQEQLRNQVRIQVDRNIKALEASFRDRGSDLRSITQERDRIEIGVFPQTIGFDFYILEPVTVVIGQANATFTFQLQTMYFIDNGMPTMSKGLWFPLAVKDVGSDKPCELTRVVLSERERRYSPSVDLTIGDPPRALASRLIEVVDFSPDKKQNIPRHDVKNLSPSPTPSVEAPQSPPASPPAATPPQAAAPPPVSAPINDRWPQPPSVPPKVSMPPQEPATPKDTADESEEEEPKAKKKKSRYERRRERRQHRHYRRSRRHRSSRNEPPVSTEMPVKAECTGDMWEKMKCAIQGK